LVGVCGDKTGLIIVDGREKNGIYRENISSFSTAEVDHLGYQNGSRETTTLRDDGHEEIRSA
jgi:hypothetical protein